MADTNFLQWNPGQSNQETDTAYGLDLQRTNGLTTGSIANSQAHNKLFYQVSTGLAALMQALVDKGYSPNDADLNTLKSVLANIITQADFSTSLGPNGYAILPNGLIFQWGRFAFSPPSVTWYYDTKNFNIAFPNAVYGCLAQGESKWDGSDLNSIEDIDIVAIKILNTSTFAYRIDSNKARSLSGIHYLGWLAIGK